MKHWWEVTLYCTVIFAASASQGAMVPFVIPAQQNPNSLISMPYEPIDANGERITVSGDKFTRGGKRVKIWGLNLSFGGNLPSHADAPVVAERIARAGINSVRLHHLDTQKYSDGIWHPTTGATIYPIALDRLDYFVNELAQRGIFINLNLHVGRTHSQYIGLPDTGTEFDNIAGIFTPALVQAQKGYAQDILEHVNPYRGLKWADDPAVAFVEIANEDSFFKWNGEESLRNLPTYYADIVQQQYNTWLGLEYGDTNSLRAVWDANTEPLGPNVITGFVEHFGNSGANAWILEEHQGCDATFELGIYDSNTAAKFTILVTDPTNWHLQVKHPNLELVQGQYYTLSFEAAAEEPRTIWCNVTQNQSPWNNLGFSRTVELMTEWQTFTFGFTANADELDGRVNFSFGGGDTTTWYLTNVQLRTGGQVGVMEDEFIETGTVRLFVDREVHERAIDRMRFLVKTEKAYFDDMKNYINNDLGCDALVTGTIVFGPLGIYAQSDMDFIDSHAYWQHPQFPGTPWDPENWYIEQKPMTDYMNEATLFAIAGERLGRSGTFAGKPFTVSEYCHSAPLDTQAACLPMLTSFAAAQDWDGLWLYTYASLADEWYENYFDNYFGFMHNPAKWGFVPAGTSIFLHGNIGPVGDTYSYVGLTDVNDPVPDLAELHLKYDSNMFGVLAYNANVPRENLLDKRIVNTLYDTGEFILSDAPNNTTIDWVVDGNGKGIYITKGIGAWVGVGYKDKFADASGGIVEVNEPNYVTLTITALAPPYTKVVLPQRRSMLITACGRAENTGMIFSPDRTTVGTNWGTAPVQIESVSATIRFPYKGIVCYALAPNGTVAYTVPTTFENNQTVVELSLTYETMWYLVMSSGDVNGDGQTNFKDFALLGQGWLSSEPMIDIAPLPFGDGIIDWKDFSVIADNWLLGVGSFSGDVNGDGQTNFKDFVLVGQGWLSSEPMIDIAPLPFGDGIVDLKDLSVLADNWLLGVWP